MDAGSSFTSYHRQGQPLEPIGATHKVSLLPVLNRSVRFDPPTSHLGQPLTPEEIEPIHIATLAIKYLTGLLAQAEAYTKPKPRRRR